MRENIDNAGLVDIRTVTVEKNLPPKERYADYKRQIKNPRRFKCGIFTVTAIYPENGATIEDCLRGMMA